MPVSAASVETLTGAGKQTGAIWRRGASLLWSLTSACSLTLLALLAAALCQLGNAEALLTFYGTSLALTIFVLLVSSTVLTCVERSAAMRAGRALVLIPNEIQSHCSQRKESDQVVTQISLYFQANNLSNDPIRLSALRLARPSVKKRRIQQATLSVRSSTGSAFGFEYPISPHSLTHGLASLILDYPIGGVGKAIRVVVLIQDHVGQWYKLVFSNIKIIGSR
jgi:hypothetical protein